MGGRPVTPSLILWGRHPKTLGRRLVTPVMCGFGPLVGEEGGPCRFIGVAATGAQRAVAMIAIAGMVALVSGDKIVGRGPVTRVLFCGEPVVGI